MTAVLERKGVTLGLPSLTIDESDPKGTFVALVSITGVKDEVNDLIIPGAYAQTLATRNPKGIFTHDWDKWTAKTVAVEEWMPGDPRLPKFQRNGQPWPTEAGALAVKGLFNLATTEGRDAYENVKFFGDECEWSIGYGVPEGPSGSFNRNGIRYIKIVDLYEYSPVLFGAAPLSTTMQVKSLATADAGDADVNGLGSAERTKPVGRPPMNDLPEDQHMAGRLRSTGPNDPSKDLMDNVDELKVSACKKCDGLVTKGTCLKCGVKADPDDHKDETKAAPDLAEDLADPNRRNTLPASADQAKADPDDPASVNGRRVKADPDDPASVNGRRVKANPDDEQDKADPDDPASQNGRNVKANPDVMDDRERAEHDGHDAEEPEDAKALPAAVKCDECGGKVAFGKCTKCGHRQSQKPKPEGKSMEPGQSHDSGGHDRNAGGAENLRAWYTHGEGATQIAWGVPGDFDRCVAIAEKHMSPAHAKGYCALRHIDATGARPGHAPAEEALHAAAGHKSAYDPTMETGEFAGNLGVKMLTVELDAERRVDFLPGSYEALREALHKGVEDLLNPVVGTPTTSGDGTPSPAGLKYDGRLWNNTSIVATFDDHLIAQRYNWDGIEEVESFQVPYTVQGDDITLGDPIPVRLVTSTTVTPQPYGVGPDAPLADSIAEVAERVAAMLGLRLATADGDADAADDADADGDAGADNDADGDGEDPAEEAAETPEQEAAEHDCACHPEDDCQPGCYCCDTCPMCAAKPIIPVDHTGAPLPVFDVGDLLGDSPAVRIMYGYTPAGVVAKPMPVAAKVTPVALERKAGRVLSAANEARMRAAVTHLLSVLAAAGIDLDESATKPRDGVPDPLADTTTTARPDNGLDNLSTPGSIKSLMADAAALNAFVLTDG